MKKVKYYYDPETLSYKRIRNRKRTKVRNALIFLTAAALFGILFSLVMINSRLFFTPREVVLAREIKTYETNYQILNKKMELVEDVLADIQECLVTHHEISIEHCTLQLESEEVAEQHKEHLHA